MKYTEAIVTFQEVPGEVSLTLSISGCPLRCMYCHSTHLREDIGIPLTVQELARLLEEQVSPHTNLSNISCVCFLGGDQFKSDILPLLNFCKSQNLKTCLYTGRLSIDPEILQHLTYAKYGPYDEVKGPLTSKTTNQRFIRVVDNADLTSQFWSS